MPSSDVVVGRRQVKMGGGAAKKDAEGRAASGTSYVMGRSGAVKGCRVPRCTIADLSGASRYCLRHRICEDHLKSLSVDFDGKPHRFCQKCSACPPRTPPSHRKPPPSGLLTLTAALRHRGYQ
jgi:hypothetical protein